MTAQPELIQPPSVEVSGYVLADTIHQLQVGGVLVTRMERGSTNGTWRLSLVWPQSPSIVDNSQTPMPATVRPRPETSIVQPTATSTDGNE